MPHWWIRWPSIDYNNALHYIFIGRDCQYNRKLVPACSGLASIYLTIAAAETYIRYAMIEEDCLYKY